MSRTILVTGASSEIGRALIRQLPADHVVLAHYFRGSAVLEELCREPPRRDIRPMPCDLSDPDAVDRFAADLAESQLAPHGVVHLAAPRLRLTRYRELDRNALETTLQIHVHSPAVLLRTLLPRMAKAGGGKVVFVLSSVTLGTCPAFMADYVVAKHAQLGLMRALVAEWAGKGIDINAVSPTMTKTQFLDGIPEKVVELAAEKNPRRRNASPDEVASAIAYLLSEASRFICGANIPITGGEQS